MIVKYGWIGRLGRVLLRRAGMPADMPMAGVESIHAAYIGCKISYF